jgi:hypothetical protein
MPQARRLVCFFVLFVLVLSLTGAADDLPRVSLSLPPVMGSLPLAFARSSSSPVGPISSSRAQLTSPSRQGASLSFAQATSISAHSISCSAKRREEVPLSRSPSPR